MSQLTTNTTTIDELITLASNLPDAGSGGEDISSETAEYTSLLTDLETAVDALPDAGGGGSVETCTVTLANHAKVAYTTRLVDGAMSFGRPNSANSPIEEVVKNTTVTVFSDSGKYNAITVTGDAILEDSYSSAYAIFVRGDCTVSIT